MVPQLTDLREEILREFHYSRFAVHPGGTKMYQDLRRQYYWSGMKRHVGDFVRRCLMCQQLKAEHQKPAGLLQPLEVAEWKWEHVTMDFVTHFPRTQQRHDAVWVIVDRLKKFVTPRSRGFVDYPSTRGIQVYVGLPDATSENRAESPLYGELYPITVPAYTCPKQSNIIPT